MKKSNIITISDNDLRSVVDVVKETRSGEYILRACPFCGKEKHCYVSKTTQQFDCKKCGESGSVYKLLKHLGKTYLIGERSVELKPQIKSIRQQLEEDEQAPTEAASVLPAVAMPTGFRVFSSANKYLSGRGITARDCRRYSIGSTALMFKYRGYILFPVYDGGEIRGFVGRYGSKLVPQDKLRYNNSLHTDFASLLYGYDDIVKGETETVIITEGIFDMISVSKKLRLDDDPSVKCVCTFGKKISDTQIRKLIDKDVRSVVLSWDFDALREIKSYGIELEQYFNVFVCVCEGKKDFGDCTAEEIIDIFTNNITSAQTFCASKIGKIKR